jgi:hypothetical protein
MSVCPLSILSKSSPSTEKRHQTRTNKHTGKDIGHLAIARLHCSGVEQNLVSEKLYQT